MARLRRKFPYAERAAEAETARRAIRATFSKVKNRRDETQLATATWLASIKQFHAAWSLAFAPGFWDDFERLRRSDAAGIETAMEFLEADPWFFRTGYLKQDLIRFLNRLGPPQAYAKRLRSVVIHAVQSRYRREFRSYCRLARRVDAPDFRAELELLAAASDPDVARRARWVLEALDQQPLTVPQGAG